MTSTKHALIEKGIFVYIVIYLLYTQFNKIIPFSLVVDSRIIAFIYSALALFGVLFLLIDAFGEKYIFRVPFADLLILFIIVCVLSTLFNYKYNFIDNLKTIVWTAVQMLLLGSFVIRTPREKLKGRVQIITNLMILVWFAAVIVSLYQFIFQIHWTVWMPDNPRITRQGFMEGRLFGVFGDPNYAGGIAFIMCVFSALNIRWNKNRILRCFYVINIGLQMCYIALSGSRTALLTGSVCIFAGVLIYLLVFPPKKLELFPGKARKTLFAFIAAVLGVVAFFGVIRVLQAELTKIPEGVTDVKEVSLEREDVEENKDISNNRFHIWADGITIFRSTPILGTSPRGHLSYAEDHFDDMYVVEKQYSLHNAYITVLACTGLAGALCAAAYIVLAAGRFIRYFFIYDGPRTSCNIILPLFLIALSIAVISCLSSLIFFGNSVFEVMFWMSVSGALTLAGSDMGPIIHEKPSVSYRVATFLTGFVRKDKASGQ